MRYPKYLILLALSVLGLTSLVGCARAAAPKAMSELTLSLGGVSELTISYDEEQITFFPAEGDDLVIREYMTDNRRAYRAKVDQNNGSLRISEGGKPFFHGNFSRYVEVYLPASYRQALIVTTTDGGIDLTGVELVLTELRVDSASGLVQIGTAEASRIHLSTTSGDLELGRLQGDRIQLESTRGNLSCDELDGQVTYTTTSGDGTFRSAIGAGSYIVSNSGQLCVTYTQVTGDLTLYNKNGPAELTLPDGLAFSFSAVTKNGTVLTTFSQWLTASENGLRGVVGGHAAVAVTVETKNGDIRVTRKD